MTKSTERKFIYAVDEAWLGLHDEPVVEPDLPIVDPHHHLWEREGFQRYLLPELLADIGSGHDVRATVFVDCHSMYRAGGDPLFASVGEVEFINGIAAASASGQYGPARACAGIVGHVDLTAGSAAGAVLEACLHRAPDRFRGIRHISAFDASPAIVSSPHRPPVGLLADSTFRAGFACLAPLGLSFDAWLYHPQIPELTALADAFPRTAIVLDHMGGVLGLGPYEGRRDEVFAQWRRDIGELARRPNVVVKLGGIGMHLAGHGFHKRPGPASSDDLIAAWRPWIETCIEVFGPRRAMFESNFPVDKISCSYRVLWNVFKRLSAGMPAADRAELFAGTAMRTYRLTM